MSRVDVLVLSMAPFKYSTRPRKSAKSYAAAGSVVRFLALQEVGRTGKRDTAGRRMEGQVEVLHLPTRQPLAGSGFAAKLLNLLGTYLPAACRLLAVTLRSGASVVQVTGTPLVVFGLLHKIRFGSLLVVDINERPASKTGAASLFSALTRLDPLILRMAARWADVCTVVTPGHRDLLSPYGFRGVQVVRNAPEDSWFGPERPLPSRPRGRVDLVAIGTIFENRGYEELIGALARVQKMGLDVQLEVYGAGAQEYIDRLRMLAEDSDLSGRVAFREGVPSAAVHGLYQKAHVGVALYSPSDPGNDSLSNKILECVAAGRPVLAGDLGENRRFIGETGCGWLTPVSAVGISETLARIASAGEVERVARLAAAYGPKTLRWSAEFGLVVKLAAEQVRRRP